MFRHDLLETAPELEHEPERIPAPGRVTLTSRLAPRRTPPPATRANTKLQRVATAPMQLTNDEAHVAALTGVVSASSPLPHHAAIQASFGHHDVSDVRAQVGGAATDASAALGARAYATGDTVAFASSPDLHLAAHEAAHVVQQRGGVRLSGGVGRAGDAYEQHADAVADLVVRGESAESLLDTMAHRGAGGGPAVQRSDAPEAGAATSQPWPNGPSSKRKSKTVPFATYLDYLKHFEQVYGVGPDTVQRLRRLYYSEGTGGAGPKFDSLTGTRDGTLPTAPPLPSVVLDGMYEADGITTPSGDEVDFSHVFVLFDLYLSGTGVLGDVANAIAPVAGVFSWTGDLASWFTCWLDGSTDGSTGGAEGGAEGGSAGGAEGGTAGGVEGGAISSNPEGGEKTGAREGAHDRDTQSAAEQLAALEACKDKKTSKSDLLGDIDAFAMGTQAPVVGQGQRSMAAVLDAYYNQKGGADQRYAQFVVNAQPPIPHVVTSASPLAVQLAGNARDAIYAALSRAVTVLRKAPVDPLEGHEAILQIIAERFRTFLETGLAGGDPAW